MSDSLHARDQLRYRDCQRRQSIEVSGYCLRDRRLAEARKLQARYL